MTLHLRELRERKRDRDREREKDVSRKQSICRLHKNFRFFFLNKMHRETKSTQLLKTCKIGTFINGSRFIIICDENNSKIIQK